MICAKSQAEELLSTMISKLSNLWPSMVPTQRKKVVRSSSLNSAV